MADQLKLRGGSKATSEQFIGAEREVTVDTTLHSLRVHDGETPGGHLMMRAGTCLVVSEPGEPCKVTVNGELETTGDTHVDGNLVVDGNLLIDGHLEIIDDTVGVDTGHVSLTNPRKALPANIGDLGTHIPTPLGELKTQEDLNQYNVNIFNEFDKALIQDDNDLKQLDQLLQAETQNRINGDQNLQNQVDELKAYNVTNDAAHSALQKSITDGDALINKRIDELKVEDLYDVDASSAEAGDILQRKGQGWAAVSASEIAGSTIEKLDDINDVNTPAPQNGQILTRRGAQWVAENNPFVDQQVKFKTFINTADVDAPVAEAGDVYVQHSIQEFATVVAGPTWTGIAGENVIEGQYIIYGSNNQWHKGTSLTAVEDVQSDWAETNSDSLTYIHNKPDLYTKEEIDDAIAGAGGANADWNATTTEPGYILNKPDLSVYAEKSELDDYLLKADYEVPSIAQVLDAGDECEHRQALKFKWNSSNVLPFDTTEIAAYSGAQLRSAGLFVNRAEGGQFNSDTNDLSVYSTSYTSITDTGIVISTNFEDNTENAYLQFDYSGIKWSRGGPDGFHRFTVDKSGLSWVNRREYAGVNYTFEAQNSDPSNPYAGFFEIAAGSSDDSDFNLISISKRVNNTDFYTDTLTISNHGHIATVGSLTLQGDKLEATSATIRASHFVGDGGGITLRSPNGTKYTLVVADDGTLSTQRT